MNKQNWIAIGLMLSIVIIIVVSCEKPQNAPGTPVIESDSIVVTGSSVICYGTVLSDGGDSIRERGICWYSEPYPTWITDHTPPVISDYCMIAGGDLGSFSRTLNHYGPDSVYYFRAYAMNDIGVSYGSEMGLVCIFDPNIDNDDNDDVPTIALLEQFPTVDIFPVTEIMEDQAVCHGVITNDGGSAIIEKGFCWRTNGSPYSYVYQSVSGSDEFQGALANLASSTTYYVRAYAVNGIGTGYSQETMFTTFSSEPSDSLENMPPMISVLSGDGMLEEGTAIQNYVEYKFGFEMSSSAGLSSLKVYDKFINPNSVSQDFIMDEIDLSGKNHYVYISTFKWEPVTKRVTYLIFGEVTDVNGLTSRDTLTTVFR